MKRISICMIMLFSGLLASGQITLNGTYNLVPGDTYRNDIYDGVTGIDPGPSGAAVNWDFGTIPNGVFIEGMPALCVDPDGTPFADSATVAEANLCTKNSEGTDGPYVYYSLTNNEQEMLGLGHYESGNTSFSHYVDKLTAIEFPFSFGDEHNDTYEYMIWNITVGGYFMKDSGSVHVEADAWGSIVTPTGTYNNVLRVTTTTTSYMWMNFGTGWNFTGSHTDVNYNWYANGIKIPVMSISEFDASQEYTVMYLADYNFPVGIAERESLEVKVFPNPASSQVWLQSDNEIIAARIFSSDGRILVEHERFSNGNSLRSMPLHGLLPGLYIIEATLKNGERRKVRLINY